MIREWMGPTFTAQFSLRRFWAQPTTVQTEHYFDRSIDDEEQTGYVLFVSDAECEGFWGPLTEEVAAVVSSYFYKEGNIFCTRPGDIGPSFRKNLRHAHSGLGALAAAAMELAAWDFVAKREGVPVWRLFSTRLPKALDCYATLFGLEQDENALTDIIQSFKLEEKIKKVGIGDFLSMQRLVRYIETSSTPCTWAFDFKGKMSASQTHDWLSRVQFDIGWVEEPTLPEELHLLPSLGLIHTLAAGEHCYTPAEFDLLGMYGVSIFQPDFAFCGGLQNYLKVLQVLKPEHTVFAHGNGVIPILHLHSLFQLPHVAEWNFRTEPRRQVLWSSKLEPTKGFKLSPPDLPGWLGALDSAHLRIGPI